MSCPFCNMPNGKHERACPSTQGDSVLKQFLEAARQQRANSSDYLVEEYINLMTAYAITMDAMEFAGKKLGRERLQAIAIFLEDVLDMHIDKMLEKYEEEDEK